MSDEELHYKVAKADGRAIHHGWLKKGRGVFVNSGNHWMRWNPLEDDAQAFSLIVKHEVLIEEADGDGWHTMCDGVTACSKDLRRAICLAVVAAHGGDQ